MNRDDAKAMKGPVSIRKSTGRTNCVDQYRNLQSPVLAAAVEEAAEVEILESVIQIDQASRDGRHYGDHTCRLHPLRGNPGSPAGIKLRIDCRG